MAQGERAGWAGKLDDEVEVVEPGRARSTHEYLYWVGCAGASTTRTSRVTEATAKLLRRAGVDFAILGPVRAVHRRPRPPLGQRVPVPDAGQAERRAASTAWA